MGRDADAPPPPSSRPQATRAVRRTSYLRGRRPRAARWLPRDTTAWHSSPRAPPGGERPATPCQEPGARGSHSTAGSQRGSPTAPDRTRTQLSSRPDSLPLPGGSCDVQESHRGPPSERQTTLGRMLQRRESASAAAAAADAVDLSRSRGATNPVRPSTAGARGESARDDRPMRSAGAGQRAARTRPVAGAAAGPEGRIDRSSAAGPRTLAPGEKTQSLEAPRTASWTSPRPWPGEEGGLEAAGPRRRDSHGRERVTRARMRGQGGGGSHSHGVEPDAPVHRALEMALEATGGSAASGEQLTDARKLIRDMKKVNTRDNTGELLLTTQVRRVDLSRTPGENRPAPAGYRSLQLRRTVMGFHDDDGGVWACVSLTSAGCLLRARLAVTTGRGCPSSGFTRTAGSRRAAATSDEELEHSSVITFRRSQTKRRSHPTSPSCHTHAGDPFAPRRQSPRYSSTLDRPRTVIVRGALPLGFAGPLPESPYLLDIPHRALSPPPPPAMPRFLGPPI